jgi:hypothetical protein
VHGRTPVLLGALAAALLSAAPAHAVVNVTTCGELLTAMGTSNDTILIAESTPSCAGSFTLTGTNVTLEDAGGQPTFVRTGSARSLSAFNPGNLVLRNLTFTSTDGLRGGASFSGTGSLLVEGSTFTRNGGQATGGGLLAQLSGAITVTGSVFGGSGVGNSAVEAGGGAFLQTSGAAVTVTNTTFSFNRTTGADSGTGAGLYVQNPGDVVLDGDTFSENSQGPTTSAGGAGAAILGLQTTVTRSTFTGNEIRQADNADAATGVGLFVGNGGVAGPPAVLRGNTFDANEVVAAPDPSTAEGGAGGGAAILGPLTAESNRWTANTIGASALGAGSRGAGLALYVQNCSTGVPSTLRNELFRANGLDHPTGGGGGLSVQADCAHAISVDNATFRDNGVTNPLGGAAIALVGSAALTLSNSILWADTGGPEIVAEGAGSSAVVRFTDACAGGSAWPGTGNLCADPLFSDATSAVVPAGSPVVDAGSNALVPGDLTTALAGGARIAEGDCAGDAVVDMGAEELTRTCPTPDPPKTDPPATTPPVVIPPVTAPPITNPGQVLLCSGRTVQLIDLRVQGRQIALRGITLASLAGKRVKITADRGGGRWTAKVAADGSFALKVPRPKSNQTSYTAGYGKQRSSPLKITRNLTVVAEKRVAGGLRVTAVHSKGKRVAGEKATVRRQTGCDAQVTAGIAKFDKRGRLTTTLAAPAGADTIAVYRITTKTNSTFTLPIVVRR